MVSKNATLPESPVFCGTICRLGLLPWIRLGGGMAQIGLPEWIYDVTVWVMWVPNWLIAFVAGRFPCAYTAPDWPLDPRLAPEKLPAIGDPKSLQAAIRGRENARLKDAEVWKLYDSLPAPTVNDMMGNWRGKVVFSGSWLDWAGLLEIVVGCLGIEWGKRFFTPYRGDPLILICWKSLIFPVPAWGNVSMPEIRLRGKSGATMTYDHQPWKDHFRILDDGKTSGRRMMLGNWFSREKNGGWFTLEELPETNAAIADLIVTSPY